MLFFIIIILSYNNIESFTSVKFYDNNKNEYSIINFNYLNDIQKNKLVNIISYDSDNPNFILNWTNNYSQLYVITDINIKNEVKGCIGIKKENNFYLVCNLFVSPKYRNLGFAKKLLNHANYIVKINGYNESYLYCLPDKLNMYLHLGWKIHNYDNNNNIYMMKINL
jgi:GNAT superfamily N-acetyltransferase